MLEKHIFKEMEKFMNSEEFSDIKVKVGVEVFKCHKIVLASWSAYFHGLFMSGMTEVTQGVVELKAIEADEFRDILTVMYTGQCEINKSNVQGLLYAASYLQIMSVEEACVEFVMNTLHKSDKERNLHYLKVSRQLNLTKLTDHILGFIASEYQIYEDYEEFLGSLCFDDMKQLLRSESLSCSSEDEICTAVLSWIDFDLDGHRQYAKELVKEIRYLALSNDFMSKTFLEHEAIKENADLEDLKQLCLEYLSKPRLQFEYIGDPVAAHRRGHKLLDVIAVCNPTSIDFLQYEEGEDGTFTYSHPAVLDNHKEEFGKFEDVKPTSISACNCGRSEILVSTGKKIYHFNGLTGAWTSGLEHLVSSQTNCLLYDQRTDYIYSVVVTHDMLFIEKCKLDSENRPGKWKMEVQKEIKQKASFVVHTRTCAYMMNDNIFFVKDGVAPEHKHASVFEYNTVTKSIRVVSVLPAEFTGSIAVPHRSLVFLVDIFGNAILRVSDDGHCIEKYGKIGHDIPNMPEDLMQNFGACICKGKLIKIGGRNYRYPRTGSYSVVDYDLCLHVTNIQHIHNLFNFENKDTVCLKLTILPHSLK
ncbi:kelch-like protein 24 isoform X2 [Mercenaria mercenaria]|nr:kelch-like protein 24 isoform X2 [Mercenaria mercenaria]